MKQNKPKTPSENLNKVKNPKMKEPTNKLDSSNTETLKEIWQINQQRYEGVCEEIAYHSEKFANHRDKINEIAETLNEHSEKTDGAIIDLARIGYKLADEAESAASKIKWLQRSIWILAAAQVLSTIAFYLHK